METVIQGRATGLDESFCDSFREFLVAAGAPVYLLVAEPTALRAAPF
jgi:hypothetical protein